MIKPRTAQTRLSRASPTGSTSLSGTGTQRAVTRSPARQTVMAQDGQKSDTASTAGSTSFISTYGQSRARSPPQIWQPSHGIVFSSMSPPPLVSSRSAFCTAASATVSVPPRAETASAPLPQSQEAPFSIPNAPPSMRRAGSGKTSQVEPISDLLASLRTNPVEQKAEGSKPKQFWTYQSHGKSTGTTPALQLCETLSAADTALAPLLSEPLLGLDLEWVANAAADTDPKRRVSLIQVAGPKLIVLIHLARFSGSTPDELVPPNLRKLLESAKIKKVGVNIRNDCNRLRDSLAVLTHGAYELSNLYKLVKFSGVEGGERLIDRRLVSLGTQCEEHLGLPLFKEQDVRSSDWTRALSEQQKLYAGSDAHAGLVLFQVLDAKRRALSPVPDLPQALEIATSKTKTVKPEPVAVTVADPNEDNDESDDSKDGEGYESADPDADYAPRAADVKPAKVKRPGAAVDQELLDAATAFAQATAADLLAERGRDAPRPGLAKLRAYYLWHSCGMEIRATAKLLDIKGQSAAGYVLEAIMSGRLEHEPQRTLQAAKMIPADVLRKRYMWFLERMARDEERKEKAA